MTTVHVPGESDVKRWMLEALEDFFSREPVEKPEIENPSSEQFLNRKQIASMLNISLVTLNIWMKQGLPRYKQHGRVYFLQSEVFDYVTAWKGNPATSINTQNPLRIDPLRKVG